MNTLFALKISCEEADSGRAMRALDGAHREIARLEDELSEFRETSPVWHLNHAPPGQWVDFTPEAWSVLVSSSRLRERTGGAFNAEAKGAPDSLEADPARRAARRLNEGARLGFGAIGKGYALDRVRALLERDGFTDYLLSAGGSSVVFSGLAAPGAPWRFGWAWKFDADGDPAGSRLSLPPGRPMALGISGTMEQGEHVLDPATGGAAKAGMVSALVAHSSAAEADALSTALFVAGWAEAQAFLDRDWPAAAVTAGGEALWNPAYTRLLKDSV